MQFTTLKIAIAGLWLAAVGAVGMTLPVSTVGGWLALVAFGLMPFVFMLRAWRRPTQTISESIQAEFRK